MGLEFRDVAAFGADMLVSGVVGSKFKAADKLTEQFTAGGISGAAGGAVGAAVAHGWNLEDIGKGALYGGLGGAGGAMLTKYASKPFTAAKTKADEALEKAQKPKNKFDEKDLRAKNATSAYKEIGNKIKQAEDKIKSAQKALNRAIASKQGVGKAQRALDKAKSDRDLLKLQHARARQAMDKANAARDKAKVAKDDNKSTLKQAKEAAKSAAGRVDKFNTWGFGSLIGLGSNIGRILSDDGGGSGGDSGTPQPDQAPAVTLIWDGIEPAVAAGLMGQDPFVQGPTPTEGAGFLLRPKGIRQNLADWYAGPAESFAVSLVDNYELFGDQTKKTKLTIETIPTLPAGGADAQKGAGGAGYTTAAGALETAAKRLDQTQEKIVNAVKTVDEVQETGQGNIGKLIAGVNQRVQGLDVQGDVGFINLLARAFSELVGVIDPAAAANEAAAGGIPTPEQIEASDNAAGNALGNSVDRFANTANDPGLSPNGVQSGLTDPSLLPDYNPGNLDSPDSASSDLADSVGNQKPGDTSLTDPGNSAYDPSNLGNGTGGSLSPITTPQQTDPMGGMMGSLLNSLPLMSMMQNLNKDRMMADTDRARDLDPSRYDRAAAPTMPQTQPAGTTPWSNNQGAATNTAPAQTQQAHHQTGAPNGATSTQTGAGAPRRVPGEDGLVPYSFPDGRSQRVSPVVAQALDKAFANKSGTDAQAAYDGTVAAWTDPKEIGLAVDPFQLMTGDVATWTVAAAKDESKVPAGAQAVVSSLGGDPGSTEEDESGEPKQSERKTEEPKGDPEFRTAILVAFGEGESGTLEAIVAGELQQYAAEMSDAAGAFGDFAGFKHPKGVEAAGDKGQDVDGAAADPAATDIPALAPA